MSDIVIIGAGGHARVLVDALRAGGRDVAGFCSKDGDTASGNMTAVPHIGDDATLLTLDPKTVTLINGVGTTGNAAARRGVFEKFQKAGFSFVTIIHPSAIVAVDCLIAEGAQIMAGAILQPGTRIGPNAIVNTGARVDHDCDIGAHAHVAPGACLAGSVTVGPAAHVGAGAVVIQGKSIGAAAIVGAGAVVISDITKDITVVGAPARPRNTG